MKLNKTSIFFIVFCLVILGITSFLEMFVGPILIGFLVSYLLNPFIDLLKNKGVSRNISATVSIIAIILIATTIIWIVLPVVILQIQTIITHIPESKEFFDEKILSKIRGITDQFNGHTQDSAAMPTPMQFSFDKISNALFTGIGESTKFLLSSVLFIVATPVFIFIFIKHLPSFYTFIYQLIPASTRVTVLDFFKDVDLRLKAVLRGQLLVVSILTVLYPIAFLIADLPTAIGIGVLVGLARLVSGLDTIVAVTLGSLVLIVNNSSFKVIISSIIAYSVVQALDAFVINPRIMGKLAGLNPILILISIISFGYWFGMYGVLLAIPIVTILKVAFQKMFWSYKTSSFFSE